MSGTFTNPEMSATLAAGLDTLSSEQTITFTKYVRVVLPLDGFVFWIAASIVSPSAVMGTSALNTSALGSGPAVSYPAANSVTVKGSLHYATRVVQQQTESYAINDVVFSAESEITDFNVVSPTVMYLGEWQGVRFAFSQRRSFYQQAGLYHYTGAAIYSTMDTQIIDDPRQLDARSLVVSNSLPLWLAMGRNVPPYNILQIQATLDLYPSFAVPVNLPPPYGVVHIEPSGTRAIQSTPYLDGLNSHWQLVEDSVTLTVYGYRNGAIMDFLDYVYQNTIFDAFGIMDYPVVQDEKTTQVELQTLAIRKKITMRINYYQARMRNIAQQLILSCVPTYNILGA